MTLEHLKSGLIVSCQSPVDSPLNHPTIIAAMAKASVNQGAVGIRVDTPSHVQEVRKQLPNIPIIGLWKRQYPDTEVYITPLFEDAVPIAQADADIIAIDGTSRTRPNSETLTQIIEQIKTKLNKLVMADVDTIENAIASQKAGADIIGTTLYGYTQETKHLTPPGYELLIEMVKQLSVPIICEGGIATPDEAREALDLGAYSVVVGTALTGIDLKVKSFYNALQ